MTVQTRERKAVRPPLPVLRVTRFDQVSAWLIALVLGLGFSVVALTAVWVAMRPKPSQDPIPVEIVELTGGVADGAVNETLQMESPEEIAEDPSLADVESPETEIEESLDNVLDLADEATNLATQQFETDRRSAGKPGSKRGTGRRALGMGPGEGGFPRDERWFIAYSNEAGLDEYARQLDFFGIELGALLPQGTMIYMAKPGGPASIRSASSGKEEQRLYMIWQGGNRRQADFQLFQRAGQDVRAGTVFHFYSKETENSLARLELAYANRPVTEIRRTYFGVRPKEAGYEFFVARQTYLK